MNLLDRLYVTLLALTVVYQLLASPVADKCTLLSNDAESAPNICRTEYFSDSQSLNILDCVKSKTEADTTTCDDFISKNFGTGSPKKICHINFVFKHVSYNQNFNPPKFPICNTLGGPSLNLRISLDDPAEKLQAKPIFTYIYRFEIDSFTIEKVKSSYRDFLNFLVKNAKEAKTMTISDCQLEGEKLTKNGLISQTFGVLTQLRILRSTLTSFGSRSLQFYRDTIRRVEFSDTKIEDPSKAFLEFYGPGSICAKDHTIDLIFKDTLLDSRIDDPINIWNTSCNNRYETIINLHVINSGYYGRGIYERPFKRLLNLPTTLPSLRIEFKHDNISCCEKDNRWLFQLDSNKTRLSIGCEDIEGVVNDYVERGSKKLNRTKIEVACPSRSSATIIVIVIVLFIGVLLVIFGYICMVYILPTRHEDIVVMNANSESFGLALDSNDPKHEGAKIEAYPVIAVKKEPALPSLDPNLRDNFRSVEKTVDDEGKFKLPKTLEELKERHKKSGSKPKSSPAGVVAFNLPRHTIKLPKFRPEKDRKRRMKTSRRTPVSPKLSGGRTADRTRTVEEPRTSDGSRSDGKRPKSDGSKTLRSITPRLNQTHPPKARSARDKNKQSTPKRPPSGESKNRQAKAGPGSGKRKKELRSPADKKRKISGSSEGKDRPAKNEAVLRTKSTEVTMKTIVRKPKKSIDTKNGNQDEGMSTVLNTLDE